MSIVSSKFNIILLVIFLSILFTSGCKDAEKEPTNATEIASTTSQETESNTEETTSLPEGVAYIMEDGTSILIEELLTPMHIYNTICSTGLSDGFDSVYPQTVIDFILNDSDIETIDDYAEQLYTLGSEIYYENFLMSNEYISCKPLSPEQLEDFKEFYLENMETEILPEYGFIVESEYIITYTDEAGEEQSDSATDYFIAYCFNGKMYLDYFYINTLDL